MARELERNTVIDKNVIYYYNPSILGDSLTAAELKDYCDKEFYKKNNKVLHVYKGRGETSLVEDNKGRHIIIRHYWRGGLVGKILKDQFLDLGFGPSANRAEEEFNLLTIMRKIGLPVPKPLVARVEKKSFFKINDIITEEIPGARSLCDILKISGDAELENEIVDEDKFVSTNVTVTPSKYIIEDEHIIKIGQCIGRFFAAGIYHSDLNINNILVDSAHNPWIIDFDKCHLRTITPRLYNKMVKRLVRSFEKEKELHPTLKWSPKKTALLLDVIKKAYKADLISFSKEKKKLWQAAEDNAS